MIESDIIYNFKDFRILVSEKAKEGSYYLLYDDFYFEEINKDTMITRDVYAIAQRYTKSLNIIKYINFKLNNGYKTKELFYFIKLLSEHTKIILTIYDPKKKDCFLLYISNNNDVLLEEIKKINGNGDLTYATTN